MTILHSQTQDEYFYLEFSQSLTICRIPSKNEIRKMLEKGWYRKFLRHGAAMLKKHIDPCQNEKQFFDVSSHLMYATKLMGFYQGRDFKFALVSCRSSIASGNTSGASVKISRFGLLRSYRQHQFPVGLL